MCVCVCRMHDMYSVDMDTMCIHFQLDQIDLIDLFSRSCRVRVPRVGSLKTCVPNVRLCILSIACEVPRMLILSIFKSLLDESDYTRIYDLGNPYYDNQRKTHISIQYHRLFHSQNPSQ